MMSIAEEVLNCPLCGSKPNFRLTSRGFGRQSKTVYGYVCSTSSCPWSYAYTAYYTKEDAVKEWNKRVCWEEQLMKWGDQLNPCKCGGKANLIYESYNGHGFWFVRCEKCQRLLTASECMNEIIEGWNQRMEKNDG
jgi:hypothetical protein